MYSIRWDNGKNLVIGQLDSIMVLANWLENTQTKFKVADCAGFIVTPKALGYGGFNFWMSARESF